MRSTTPGRSLEAAPWSSADELAAAAPNTSGGASSSNSSLLHQPLSLHAITTVPTNASTDGGASLDRERGVLVGIVLLIGAALAAAAYCWLRHAPELWYLRGQRKWISLVVVSLTSSLAMIPQMSWETLQPAMLDSGIFQCDLGATREGAIRTLNSVYNVGLGVSAAAQARTTPRAARLETVTATRPRRRGATTRTCRADFD
jgi:hypothetical protein